MKPETALIIQFRIHWGIFDIVCKDKEKYVFATFIYEYSKLETIIDLMDMIMPRQINIEPLRQGLNRRYTEYLRRGDKNA